MNDGLAIPGSVAPVARAPRPAPVADMMSDYRAGIRALLAFALCCAALIAFFFETASDLWNDWSRSGTYAHGFFILPISAWLVWRLRDDLKTRTVRIQPLAIVPLVACGVLWLAGHTASVHPVVQYAFVGMIPCLVWGVFGNDVTRRILYPLAFLFFAVPAGDFLLPTLMDHTADFTISALRLSGVPVFREGNFFSIPSGNWSVVEACSGLRYLIASITLGVLFAYLNYRAAWRRAAFIAAAIGVPIVANWLRAYMIVMIAHLSSNKLATGVDHIVYGWLFFGVVMMVLFWVGNFWRDDFDDAVPSRESTAPARVPSSPFALSAMTVALIAFTAPWPTVGNRLETIADAVRPGPIAIGNVPGWTKTESFTAFRPHYESARSSENAAFVSTAGKVDLYVGYYSGQLDHGLMVTFANDLVLLTDKVWGVVARRARAVAAAGSLTVDETEIRGEPSGGSLERLLTWRWYWINGRLTTNPFAAKAYNAIDKLTGRGDDSAVIVVTTPMDGPVDPHAARTLAAFVEAAEPVIRARLTAVHDEARR